jgi:hypothetical protein
MRAALTTMNGARARGLQLCSSRAATSLPTPAGPHRVDRHAGTGQLGFLADLCLQRLILAAQPVRFGGAVDEMKQMARFERLLDEVDRPLPDCGDRGVEIAVAGNHQHRQGRIAPLDVFKKLQAVELGALQPNVEQDQRGPPLSQRRQRLVAVRRSAGRIALVFEHPRHEVPNILLIVNNKDI